MDRVWERFKAGDRVHWTRIWSLLVLVLWWRGSKEHAFRAVRDSRARSQSRPAAGPVAHIMGG